MELKTRAGYVELAEKLARWGEARVELPCGAGETVSILVGELGTERSGLSEAEVRAMVVESITQNLEGLEAAEWTHLGETPEVMQAKLRRAQICLPIAGA